jgi:hypothetical protein
MANPWEEFQDDEADSATGTLTPEAIGPWSDFSEPEEEDEIKPWEAFKEPDPIGDYNSAAAIAEKLAKSRETNYAKYNELAQIPERTPEIVQQMVSAFNAGKEAEAGLYGEQERLNTLRPEVDRIQSQRAEERRNQIESKRLDPAFGDSVADQLYQFDSQMAAEMEQARSIVDIEERNTAFESIAKKYADQENGLIKSSAEGYANRFDSARETAWLLRQLEVNNKRAWADYGASVAEGYGDIPFDMPDRPEGLKVAEEAWQGVKETQNKNRAETEEAISKLVSAFPADQQEQIRRDAEEWISVQKGEKEVAIVQGRPVFSKDVQGDYDRAKELVDDLFAEGEINEIQRTASIEALDATAAAEREDKLKFVRELPDYAQRAEGKTDDEVLEEYESSRTGFVSSVMDYFSGASEGFGGYIDMAVDGQRLRDTLDSGDEEQSRELAFELIQKTIDKQQQNADPFRDPTAAQAGQVIGQVGAQITSQKAGEVAIRGLSLAVSALLKSPTINQLGQQAAPWIAGAANAVANANIYGLDWFQTTVQDFLETANVQNINDLSDDQKKQLYKEATDAFYASQLPSVTELIEPTMFLKLPKAARKSMIGRTIDGAINVGVEIGQEKFTEEWKEAYMRNAVSAHQAQSTMGMDDMKAMALGLLPLGGAKFAVDTVRARRETVTERRLQDLEKADAARAEQLRAEQAAIAAAEEAANNAATVTPESADAMKQAVEAAKTDVETKITEGLREGLVRLPEDFIAQRNQTVNQALERIRANDDSQILQDVTNVAVDEVVRPAEGLNPVTVRGLKDDVTYLENLINKNEFKVSEIDKTRFKTFMAPENYERFVQVVESSPQEAISSLRGLVDDYVGRGEVPVEGAGGGEEEEARVLPAVRTIADSIQDKDTFIYEGMRGALNEEDGEVVFRPFGTQEKYTVAVNPNQTLDQVEGIQWARRGQRRIRPEEERVETTTIVEQAPTVTTEEADTTEDSVQFPQALVEIERSPTLNFFADLFDTGESKVSQEGKRTRKVSETPEFYRQVQPEQIEQANRLVDSALRIIDAMPISEDQKADLSEPFLLLDQDISTYESNPNYQRYKSSIVREVRPPVEAGAVPETEAEVAAGVTELEQRAAAEVSRLEQEAQARRVAAGQAAFVAVKPTDLIGRVARNEATPQEFESLVEQGLAEEYKGQQVITQAGVDALPENERPRLTPEARRIQIDTGASEVVAEAISKGLRFGVDQVPPTFKLPQGWTLDGEIYTPPPRTATEEVARIAEQYGVDEATATSIFNNEVFEVPREMSRSENPPPFGWTFETRKGKLYAIPQTMVKKRLAAQGELRRLSILEQAALSGMLTEQGLLVETDAKEYIQKANNQGFTADEIAAATTAAEARWNERFGDNGNARQVAGDVSPPVVDHAAEEAQRATRPRVTGGSALPSADMFGMTAREALQFLADKNLGASDLEATGRSLNLSQMMQRAASVLAKLPLRMLDADFIKRERGGARAYRANEGFIRVPATVGGQPHIVMPETLVHEVGHTLTSDAIRKYVEDRAVRGAKGAVYLRAMDKALADPNTPEQIKRLVSLYKQTIDEMGLTQEYFGAGGLADMDATRSQKSAWRRKNPLINKFTGKKIGWDELYGLSNLDEFVAMTWSSTAFQDLLKNIKVQNQPSIYERFVRIIRDLFGFDSDTMAAAVVDASYALAELEAPATGGTVEQRIAATTAARGAAPETGGIAPLAPEAGPVTPQQDRDYLDAVERGDLDAASRMVDKAAKAAGYTFGPVWHGTRKEFTRFFNQPTYFSESEQFAKYTVAGKQGRVIKAYLRGNLFDPRNPEHRAQVGEMERMYGKLPETPTYQYFNAAVQNWLQENGWDGHYEQESTTSRYRSLVVFDPMANAKSAEPVTRDDAGNIIPPSQRFQPTEADIRYAPLPEPTAIIEEYAPRTDEEQKAFNKASTNKILRRNPQLAVAAVRMKNGEITAGDYADLVDAVDPFVPKGADPIPTDEKIKQYMAKTGGGTAKLDKVGLIDENGNPKLDSGSEYEFRIDIPTYNESTKAGDTVYAITAHLPVADDAKTIGSVAAFTGIAKVTDPRFMTREMREGGALTIAMGAGKFRLATVKGKYEPITELPIDINDPDSWTEVGYNPVRSSLFVDTRTGQAVVGGSEAIMVGSRVFVKDAQMEARPTGVTFGAVYAPEPEPDANEDATPEEVTQTVTNRAEAKKAQELVTGHSILADEIPTELNEEAQARYENGMALGDFLAPEFFNLGEAYKPYISAIWLNLNGGLMPTVKVEGKEIAKPEKGTTEAEALRLLKRATDILDARSETTGGKDLTYSLQDIMATWMESGLGQAALKNAIVQYTNLDVAQADKTATDFARVYELAQDVTSAKERAQVRTERALPAVTNRQQREKERMIKLEEASGTIDSIAEAIRVAFDVNIAKPKTDRATEKKQIEEQLRQAKRIIREVVPRQYLGDQLLTLERATGLEGLKKVVEAAQNGLNEARLDDATSRARKAYDRAQKAVKANEISPEAMAVLRDFVETYSKKGIGPETRAKIEEAMQRYEADPVGALEDLAVQKYLKQKGALQTIKIDKSLGLDALREIAAMVNSTLHADKVARGEMLFNKQQTRMELVDEIATEIDQVKSIAKARKDGGMGIGLFNKIALYKGARVENILRAFGLNKLREFVYDRLTLDAYNDELRVRRDLKKKIEARVKDITGLEIGTRDYDLWSKEIIELTGVDSSGVSKPIKIQRREFLDMVASLRDESNFRRAVNSGGYVIDRLDTAAVDTVKITPDTYFEILNKMGDQDTQMVDMMVDLYNNDLFSILENASLQAYGHGIKGVTGTYYPRTADKWTRTTETKKDMDYIAYYQRRVDDVGYLKERDERSKSKLRAVDFLQRLDYHVTNDARIGAYLPIVRDIEMVLNDPKIARPLAQKIGEEGLEQIKEMVRQQTTPPAGLPMGLMSTLVGNAGVGVLGFKLHAAMQNPVGIPIALAYYGKDGFKYLAKAFPYGVQAMKPQDRRDMVAVLSKYSPYYNERYGDGGFIQEFTSGLSNAPSDTKWRKNLETAAMSWLEGTDRWGALVRYKIAQQVVRDRTALQDGTEDFNRAVATEWNKMMFRSENTAHGADRTGAFQFAGRHPVFKVFIMFQSAVSKQYSLFVEAMLQAQQGGRQNLQDAATKLAFLSISLAASKAISQAFYSVLFPPEDEEEKEKTWAQLLGKVAGTPLSIVPVVGPTLQNFTESFFSPDQMRKPMQIDLISSFIFGIGDTLALTRKAFDQLTDEQIDEATGNAKFWETSYRALKKALAVGGIPTGVPAAGVVQTGELGLKLVENLRNVFNDEPKTEDFQKKVQEYEKSQKSEPVRQEMAKLFFAVTENDQKAFNRAYKDILKKRPDIKRSDLINSIRRRQDFRVVGMVRSGKLKQKDLETSGISRDYYLEQKALLRSVEKAAATMWRDAKDSQ